MDESTAAKNITVVHVVQSCHLDIGFTSTMVDVINLYFRDHIPSAIAIGKAMRNGSSSWAALPGALSSGNDLPGWPRNATVDEARLACSKDANCSGVTYRNSEHALKKIYLKDSRATVTADANWTYWTKPSATPLKPGWRLRFTMQAWYISMYMHCPAGLGLQCPTDAEKAALRGAIAAGDVTWHAFPHNAELEAGSASVIRAALKMTHALDAEFGLPPKAVLSQRDVPGLTRAMIPILKQHGVEAVSVGVNGCVLRGIPAKGAEIRRQCSDPGA